MNTIGYLILVGVVLAMLGGCATTGQNADDSLMAELFQDVTDINCIAAFSLGKRLGDTTTIQEDKVQTELAKHVDLEDLKQLECYKAGLVYNRIGGGVTIKALKGAVRAASMVAK